MEANKEHSSSDDESSDVSVDSEVNKKLQDLKSILAKTDTPLLNESGMPVANSSKEILSQLFRVLKADSSSVVMPETKENEQTIASKKSKKSKKKHKHKEKKHKKHKSNKSEPDTEKKDHDDSCSHKRKHKHSSTNSDSKKKRVIDNTEPLSMNLHISSKDESISIKQEPLEVTPDIQVVEYVSLEAGKVIESCLVSKEIEMPNHSPPISPKHSPPMSPKHSPPISTKHSPPRSPKPSPQTSKECEAKETPISESPMKHLENECSIDTEEALVDLAGLTLEEADIQQSVFFTEMSPTLSGGTSGKPAGAGKIIIKSLRFTSVFNVAVKDVETESVLKVEDVIAQNLEESGEKTLEDKTPHELQNTIKFGESCEEGEISDSSTAVSKHSTTNSKDDSPETKQENKVEDNVPTEEKKDKRKRRHSRKKSEEEDRSSRRRKHHSHDEKRRSVSKSKDQKVKRRSKSKPRKTGSDHNEKDKERKKDQSKEPSRESRTKRSRSKDRHNRTKAKRSRSRDSHHKRADGNRDNSKDGRSHKRARSHAKSPGRIDKHKLLEIARKNAMSLLKQGALPPSVAIPEKVVAVKAGGKTVAELTDFCKQLSKKEALAEGMSESDHDDLRHSSDSDLERPFHHPFQIKERPCSIVMNIRNAVQLPVKTLQEKTAETSKQLRIQFPVSSGQQHRKTETEWVPVSPKKETVTETSEVTSGPLVVLPAPSVVPAVPKVETVVFDTPSMEGLDIGSIVSQRLTAMRKLQENPYDSQALSEMYKAQKNMQSWAESKQLPGQFTGSTGVKFLTPAELSSGNHAWAKKVDKHWLTSQEAPLQNDWDGSNCSRETSSKILT